MSEPRNYDTLSEALEMLKNEGYEYDFNLKEDRLECKKKGKDYKTEDFNIVQVARFEGMSNPDDNSVVYAIEANDGTKGLLTDAYGTYSQAISPAMAKKLSRNSNNAVGNPYQED